jgi:hypothetical protein
MKYDEEKKDLFTVKNYTLAHCISSDCRMGAGIAIPMKKKFNLQDLINFPKSELQFPTCIYYHNVMNLITKERYFHKPTYQSMEKSLYKMKTLCYTHKIIKIAMPLIGCGLDGLSWNFVRDIIIRVFNDTDIEILVCIKD